jgi:hypothetical protein
MYNLSKESILDCVSAYNINEIEKRIDALHSSCDIQPIPSYIIELSREFDNRNMVASKYFNLGFFKDKLLDLEKTIELDFNRFGMDRQKALSGGHYNRMLFEVHNVTTFTIRYFSCRELANTFIGGNKDEFKLAKVFNAHHEMVHTLYF